MRINNNIQALNAYRNLAANQFNTSKSLEKLSSGLRINRAADDAAGLAISEKMRSQIRGLKQAERNSMDGISLIQTAEGALGSVHFILQRMRELAVQAANGTLEDEDRTAIQSEIDQLTKEIDRIADTTQFNKRQLLAGDAGGRPFVEASDAAVQYTSNGVWNGIVNATPTEKAAVQIEFDYNFGAQAAAAVDGTTFSINGKVYEVDIQDGTNDGLNTSTNIAINLGSWNNITDGDAKVNVDNLMNALASAININDSTFNITASEITPADNSTAGNSAFETPGTILIQTAQPMSIAEAAAITISTTATTGVDLKDPFDSFNSLGTSTTLKADSDAADANQFNLTFSEVPKDGDSLTIDNFTITFKDTTTPTGYSNMGGNATAEVQVGEGRTIENVLNDINSLLTGAKTDDLTAPTPAVSGLTSHSVSGGTTLVLSTAKTDDGGAFGSANGLEIQYVDNDYESNAGKALAVLIQSGANNNEALELEVNAMDAASLGLARDANHQNGDSFLPGNNAVAGIDVSTEEAASNAIAEIDQAITLVSNERAKLGAYQNRLEYSIENLQISTENLTSAESRIRDVDMALEMTNFTKNNILNQSAQAMLAQANQLPQGVLQLLQG